MALPPDCYSLYNGFNSISLWYMYPTSWLLTCSYTKYRRKKTRAAARAALVAVLLLGDGHRGLGQLVRCVMRIAGCAGGLFGHVQVAGAEPD